MVRKIGILTSGGDAPGMNAAIRSVVKNAHYNNVEIYGIHDGYRGLIEGKIFLMTKKDIKDIVDKGGTILGSARLPEFKEKETQQKAIEQLKKHGIEALVVIGGDGTYRGAMSLIEHGINCVGIPATIDNDISCTDWTIGFNTALQTVVDAIDKLRDTSSSHHRCSVVEVMGNRCGDLALYSGLATGAELVITSETGFDEKQALRELERLDKKLHKDHAIVIVSEKILDVNDFAEKISKKTSFSGRATVLGHVQRGGSPTPQDRILAAKMGEKAVELLLNGIVGHCVCLCNGKMISKQFKEALAENRQDKKKQYELFDKIV